MRGRSQATVRRYGLIVIASLLVLMFAAFNLGRLPWFAGSTYHAYFTDASGLHSGSEVQVGGIRVGRVSHIRLDGARVLVDFTVKPGVEFGTQTSASIDVLNLLGEKYLQLDPAGTGQLPTGTAIPLERTTASYDIVNTLGQLTETTEHIDKRQLRSALDVLSDTVRKSSPELGPTLSGVSRLSRTIASRDASVRRLLHSAHAVTRLLAARRGDLVGLMKDSDVVFRELRLRHEAIHDLLVNARTLADQLGALARENRKQIGPALREVDQLLTMLNRKDAQLRGVLHRVGPYASILGNIVGTGPWFDAYAVNLAGIPTGEFVPGAYQ